MNQAIRKFLIDQSIKGIPVNYEVIAKMLNLDLHLDKDRHTLSHTLGEISEYEFKNDRPLISAIAIYKQTNDHGDGFYQLCEDLGIGNKKQLKEQIFGFTALEEAKNFWKDNANFQKFYELPASKYNETNSPPFFNKEEIIFFKKWAGKTYDPNNSDHVNAKNYLLNTLWWKTKFWSEQVINYLPQYEQSSKRMWQKRGHGVSIFKDYTWARIFKKGDREKEIFFTVGADPQYNALIYKLDYSFEKSSMLSEAQKKICEKYIPSEIRWIEIRMSDLDKYNWEKLINETVEFISSNSHHYEQLEKMVWSNTNPQETFNNSLSKRSYPKGGFVELPIKNPSFKGYTTDFIQKSIDDKQLGDCGEELVKDYERKKLLEKGLHNLAEKVEIKKDGEGYDILSFDEYGNEIFIEVKTTEKAEKTPFYLSLNEYLFADRHRQQYVIYRLYNYNDEKNHADFFIIEDPINQLLFQPTQYQVYLKKKDNE